MVDPRSIEPASECTSECGDLKPGSLRSKNIDFIDSVSLHNPSSKRCRETPREEIRGLVSLICIEMYFPGFY